jgi:hypothetical protein
MKWLIESFYSVTFWTAFGAILQGAGAIIAYSALHYSITSFTTSLNTSSYTELDRMYFDVLRMAVERPHLIDPNAARNGERQREYDAYAYMVWNIMESIYDRCHGDSELCETWYPVIDAEERRHWRWFDDPKNQLKFKKRFGDFIHERYKKSRQHQHLPSA